MPAGWGRGESEDEGFNAIKTPLLKLVEGPSLPVILPPYRP